MVRVTEAALSHVKHRFVPISSLLYLCVPHHCRSNSTREAQVCDDGHHCCVTIVVVWFKLQQSL